MRYGVNCPENFIPFSSELDFILALDCVSPACPTDNCEDEVVVCSSGAETKICPAVSCGKFEFHESLNQCLFLRFKRLHVMGKHKILFVEYSW